jgi:hypothetical protein
MWSGGANAQTPASGANVTFDRLAVYGDHGLTTYPALESGSPDGVFASDVIKYLIATFCPELNSKGVQDTTYPIPHLVFRDRTAPYDAFLTVNSFHRWELACWENGTVHYGPATLDDYEWELRLDDFGTSFEPQGKSTEDVANGIEVSFTDVTNGRQTTLLPDDHSELRDDSYLNPVNRAGLYRAAELQLSEPATTDMALQLGRTALAEFNLPKSPGTASKQAFIRDRAGNDQPVWMVRAGDRVRITDHPDDRVHYISETNYSHDSRSVSLTIDDGVQRLDAVLARMSAATTGRLR